MSSQTRLDVSTAGAVGNPAARIGLPSRRTHLPAVGPRFRKATAAIALAQSRALPPPRPITNCARSERARGAVVHVNGGWVGVNIIIYDKFDSPAPQGRGQLFRVTKPLHRAPGRHQQSPLSQVGSQFRCFPQSPCSKAQLGGQPIIKSPLRTRHCGSQSFSPLFESEFRAVAGI